VNFNLIEIYFYFDIRCNRLLYFVTICLGLERNCICDLLSSQLLWSTNSRIHQYMSPDVNGRQLRFRQVHRCKYSGTNSQVPFVEIVFFKTKLVQISWNFVVVITYHKIYTFKSLNSTRNLIVMLKNESMNTHWNWFVGQKTFAWLGCLVHHSFSSSHYSNPTHVLPSHLLTHYL